jgi:hypothetical protein
VRELIERLDRQRLKYPDTINDDLLLKLAELAP